MKQIQKKISSLQKHLSKEQDKFIGMTDDEAFEHVEICAAIRRNIRILQGRKKIAATNKETKTKITEGVLRVRNAVTGEVKTIQTSL